MYRDIINIYKQHGLRREWDKTKQDESAPFTVKYNILMQYARAHNIELLVETGTCLGQMVYSVKNNFEYIYTIELDRELFRWASLLFRKDRNITVYQGNSIEILPGLLDKIDKTTLFWLDAHYSGGTTARGDKETPIVEELKLIINHRVQEHVIFIDDARCFNGTNDYPTIDAVMEILATSPYSRTIEIEHDIIRITPTHKP